MPAGLSSLSSPLATAAYARFQQLSKAGMPNEQIIQTLNQEGIMPPLGELAAKLMAVKNAAQQQQQQMPPQDTINQQLDQQLQAAQNPQQPQGVASLPQNAVQAPQGQPQAPQGAAPQQSMPQQAAAPQPMPPQAPQGVASLPTPNVGSPAAYASGGIVAFSDGGDVEHFQFGGTAGGSPFDRSPGQLAAPSGVDSNEYALFVSNPNEFVKAYGFGRYNEVASIVQAQNAKNRDIGKNALVGKLSDHGGMKPVTASPEAAPTTNVDADINALASKYMSASNPYAGIGLPDEKKIWGDFDPTVDIEDYTSKVKSAKDYAKENFEDLEAYKKEHGIGKAETEYLDFLEQQKGESEKDYKFNNSMALAEFGFTLASTPGSFLQGMAKSGSGLARNMMELNAQKKVADREYQKALLQAKAAKENGDLQDYKDSQAYGQKMYEQGINLAYKMSDHVQNNNQLMMSFKDKQINEGYQRASTQATIASGTSKNATTAKLSKLMQDPAFNAMTPEQQQQVLGRVTMPEQLAAGLSPSGLSSSLSNKRIMLKSQYDAAVKEYQAATFQGDSDGAATAKAKMDQIEQEMASLTSGGIGGLSGTGGLSDRPSVGGSTGVIDFSNLHD